MKWITAWPKRLRIAVEGGERRKANSGESAGGKGFFDRLLILRVALLNNIRKSVGVVTCGQGWRATRWMGEVPLKTVTRFLPWFTNGGAKAEYPALYDVDGSTDGTR